jgi:PTS system nitrogen regulatory IIA component
MTNPELLIPERVRCQVDITSKKRTLEVLSELIASGDGTLAAADVLNCLISREKLSSTGLGHGVAIPHARMADVTFPIAAALTLHAGVDFDAPDGEPVDLVVGLIVPAESTEEHLNILATLAESFSDPSKVRALREAATPESVYKLLNEASG